MHNGTGWGKTNMDLDRISIFHGLRFEISREGMIGVFFCFRFISLRWETRDKEGREEVYFKYMQAYKGRCRGRGR